MHEAGGPAGVLNVVPGTGAEAGEALVTHPLVRKIGFDENSGLQGTLRKAVHDNAKRVYNLD